MMKIFFTARFWRPVCVLSGAFVFLLLSDRFPDKSFLQVAAHEIGFALLVSFIVWLLFELHMAQEAENHWASRIERIAQNVFFAVLRKDLPKELVDEARALALDASLLRSGFNVTYTLMDDSFEVRSGEREPCVLIGATMSFKMQNIAAEAVMWKAGVGLPNPIHPDLKDKVRINSAVVSKNGAPLDGIKPKEANEAFRNKLLLDESAVFYHVGDYLLEPGETVEFQATYTMAKEFEDTEFLQTKYPCDGMRVTVMDQCLDRHRVVFARSVHRKDIDILCSEDNPGTKIFTLSGYLLPQQGILIWWKQTPAGTQDALTGVK